MINALRSTAWSVWISGERNTAENIIQCVCAIFSATRFCGTDIAHRFRLRTFEHVRELQLHSFLFEHSLDIVREYCSATEVFKL